MNDFSGCSVSLSADGTRLAIGAFNNNFGNGHVRVYEENGGSWTKLGADIDGETGNGEFGASVSLSGDGKRLAIGAPNIGSYSPGNARVYEEIGGIWTQLGDELAFGASVSLSADGTRLAIGARPFGGKPGFVRVYSESGDVWTQLYAAIHVRGQGPAYPFLYPQTARA